MGPDGALGVLVKKIKLGNVEPEQIGQGHKVRSKRDLWWCQLYGDLQRPMTNTREKQVTVVKSQFEIWKLTGVIALSDSDIKVAPQEVWNCGFSVRFLDLNCNLIQDIPESISGLSSLQIDYVEFETHAAGGSNMHYFDVLIRPKPE
ncbi:hypothetical protein L1887_29500 [Cichorium endivia]|nr:hypothetical protein L1887_29500 [Cichorium endivia]